MKYLLLQLNPELAHELTIKALQRIGHGPLLKLIRQQVAVKPVTCMGLTFKNPLGLAAGLDKNGTCIDALGALGFGFIEIGTVTPRPQPGNPPPRLFRIKEAEGMINRMGCNNLGVDAVVEALKTCCYDGIIGVNIGKNSQTPLEQAVEDYLYCLEKVYPYAGYVTLNLSSPNTPGLRDLQQHEHLDPLLKAIKEKQSALQQQYHRFLPIAVKVSPDLTQERLILLAETLLQHAIDGVIATNTTCARTLVRGLSHSNEAGGMSGRPLQQQSTETIRTLASLLKNRIPIIGVGGIDSIIAAREKIQAGASLLQLYSGLIYHGPALVKTIIAHL